MKIKVFSVGNTNSQTIQYLKSKNISKIVLYNNGYPGAISEKSINLFVGSKKTKKAPIQVFSKKTYKKDYDFFYKETKKNISSLKYSLFSDFINIFVLDPCLSDYAIMNNILDNKNHEYFDRNIDSIDLLITSYPLSINENNQVMHRFLKKIIKIPPRKTPKKPKQADSKLLDDPNYLDSLLVEYNKNYLSDYKKLSLIIIFDFEKLFLKNKKYTEKEKKEQIYKIFNKTAKTNYYYKNKYSDIIESNKPFKNIKEITNEDSIEKTKMLIINFIDNLSKLKNMQNFKKFIEKTRKTEKTHVLVLDSKDKIKKINKLINSCV